jgi:hypothetical protein
MPETVVYNAQNFDYYNYNVIVNFVFATQKPVINLSYEYEEKVVFYCATATQEGVYRYSYCLNNPLKYTDPSGERWLDVDDIWEFDREGRFIQRIDEPNYDQMRVINADGNIFAESKKFEYGFFKNKMDFLTQSVLIAGRKYDLEGLSMNFGENYKGAMTAFTFLAEHTDPTEWTIFGRNNFKGGMDNLLYTTHRSDFEYFGSQYAKSAAPVEGLFYDFHSHDKNSPYFPSDKVSQKGQPGDREFRYGLISEGQSPNAIFGILHKGILYDYRGFPIKNYLNLFK